MGGAGMLECCLSFTAAYTVLEDFHGVLRTGKPPGALIPQFFVQSDGLEGICSSQTKATQEKMFCLRLVGVHGTSEILNLS